MPKDNLGTASSMLTLGRTLGQTIATGIFGLIFNLAVSSQVKQHRNIQLHQVDNYISSGKSEFSQHMMTSLNQIVLSGMHAVFMGVLLFFLVAIILNVSDKNKRPIK